MTRVVVNGEAIEVSDGATVAAIVARLGLAQGGRGVAVAVDGEVVPRAEWEQRSVPGGARVEVVQAIQGG